MTTFVKQSLFAPIGAGRALSLGETKRANSLTPALTLPFWRRLERGEGLLVAVNAVEWVRQGVGPWRALLGATLSLAVMAHMYAFNDWSDARQDLRNPRKDSALAALMIARRGAIGVALAAGAVGCLLVAWLLAPRAALWTAVVLGVNAAYSLRFKKAPLADLAWVAFWGFSFVAMASRDARFCALAGVMTAVCHVFQILIDRAADGESGLRTTAVVSPALTKASLAVLCGLLATAIASSVGPWWALSAAAPIIFALLIEDKQTGWMASRAYFAVVLAAAWRIRFGLA